MRGISIKAKRRLGGSGAARAEMLLPKAALILPYFPPPVKVFPLEANTTPEKAHLAHLVHQADQKARLAEVSWRTARATGQPVAVVCWHRRLMLAHQAVFWAARRVLAEKGER